ncbi:hypothetical protein GW915_05490 [bacterium]|nr:hypothetical protein [bacterium]
MSAKNEKLINLYLVLDITPGTTQNEILHAYNRAKNTYSDHSVASYAVFDDDSKEDILQEIEHAFEVLGSPAKRRDYDLKMGFETWKDEDHSSHVKKNAKTVDILEKRRLSVVKPSEDMASSFVANPKFENEIEECAELTGEFLKAVRIYRQTSEDELARMTRLSHHHIRAIEGEDGTQLHHPVYLRGHLTLICQTLEIPNARELANTYVDRLLAEGKVGGNQFSL